MGCSDTVGIRRLLRKRDKTRPFVYQPLESPRHIRLLRMSAPKTRSRSGDGLLFELVHVSLDDCQTVYRTVSYVWGEPIQDHSLKMNERYSLPVTQNLAVALPKLIRICSTDHIWIDQICIDQWNNEERGQQVAVMGEIFKNSVGVLIWTGGELDGFHDLMTHMEPGNDFNKSHIETMVQLLCRPWFSRGWTIQEAVLAKSADLVAGASVLSLEMFEWAWQHRNNTYSRNQLERSRTGSASFELIMALRRGLVAPYHDSGFDGLLNSFGDTQTTDARDHIYAFLSLNQDTRISIKPDYSASICDVFTNATRAIIKGTGTLDCFRFLPSSYASERIRLPSWVPDWSVRNRESRLLQDSAIESSDGHPPFKAAKGYPHSTQKFPVLHSEILHVSGHFVDSIEARLPDIGRNVYMAIFPEHETPVTARPFFFSLTNEQAMDIEESALTDSTQSLRKRLMSVIVAGHVDAEDMLARYDNGNENYPKNHFLSLQLRRMWNHQVWITRERRLALIPPIYCESGDMIAIAHGSDAPLLLRTGRDGTYVVGGQCYLEGAMFGEAATWEEDKAATLVLT